MRIAIIGTGIAGLGAAWLAHRRHEVTLFEAAAHVGGHSHTVEVPKGDGIQPVDTGFIVYNEVNYPNLTALFAALNVPTEASDMSFSVSIDDGRLEWAGHGIGAVFAQKRNLLRPGHWRMVRDILRFNRRAPADLSAGRLAARSLGDYLADERYGVEFREHYLLPMGAAIWSASLERMLDFPAQSYVRFFVNHALLSANGQHQWRTVSGGSREYVRRLIAPFRERVQLNSPVRAVRRTDAGAELRLDDGAWRHFDALVLACHGDSALALLSDPSQDERAILGAFGYQKNRAVLHRDSALMPKRRAAWASWNYLSRQGHGSTREVCLTYSMNRLQNIDPAFPLYVSMNPDREPRDALTFASFAYDHPLFDAAAIAAQARLDSLQGVRHTWFCGSYFGYGFHEDGLVSGLAVAEALGARRPWAADTAAARPPREFDHAA